VAGKLRANNKKFKTMKHHVIYAAMLIASICSFNALDTKCFAQKEVFNDGASTISGAWVLLPALASDTVTGKPAFIDFNTATGNFAGNTGCNTMNGKFTVNGNMLQFKEPVVDGKNSCPGYNEDIFMANLLKINHFKMDSGVLQLMIDETVVSKWVRKQPGKAVKSI